MLCLLYNEFSLHAPTARSLKAPKPLRANEKPLPTPSVTAFWPIASSSPTSLAPAFESLLRQFLDRFGPVDGVEFGMIEEMTGAYWRQRRAWAMEKQMLVEDMDKQPESPAGEVGRLTAAFTDAPPPPNSPSSTATKPASTSCSSAASTTSSSSAPAPLPPKVRWTLRNPLFLPPPPRPTKRT